MAGQLAPLPAPSSFDVVGAQAVIGWIGADSQLRHLYQSAPDPSRQVTFEARFDATAGSAFFKIRAAVGMKAAGNAKTPLYLYIHCDRITSLSYNVPDTVPDVVKGKLGPHPGSFQFTLTQPADMVVPSASLTPQNRSHGDILDSMKLLAAETRFSVYLPHELLSEAQVRPLCDAVARRTLKSIDAASDLKGLYGGAGGKVLEGAELCIPVTNSAPPAYNELAPAPPGSLVKSGSTIKAAGSSRKRRRGSSSSATSRFDTDAMAACKKMVEDMMSQHRQEERAYYSKQLQQLRESFSEDLRHLKTEMLEHMEQRLGDLEGTLCSVDDVDEQITRHVSDFEDLIEVKIEDHVAGIKIELEDFVDSEVANAEDRVLRRVRDASWTVAIDELD
ncbi:unnamed protein product [Discula destructiva]